MQVRFLDDIAIDEAKGTDSCSCQIGCSRTTETAHAYEQHLGFTQAKLSCSQENQRPLLLQDPRTQTNPVTRSRAL